jgi:hypothetical protein
LQLSAGTALHRYTGVDLEHQITPFILVENTQETHLLWDTAGLWDPWNYPNRTDYTLDGSMIRGMQYLVERGKGGWSRERGRERDYSIYWQCR